jgi:GNAT superfamily N-acetyltransferase
MTPSPALTSDDVTLRPVSLPDDTEFLRHLYFSVRDDLVGLIEPGEQLDQMLMMQFEAQRRAYESEYPNAEHDIVLLRGEPVGRLIVERRPESLFGIDLALLPKFRSQGVGRLVVAGLIEVSAILGLPFQFSVLKTNRAINLYKRLGCVIDGENPSHFLMSWRSGKNE